MTLWRYWFAHFHIFFTGRHEARHDGCWHFLQGGSPWHQPWERWGLHSLYSIHIHIYTNTDDLILGSSTLFATDCTITKFLNRILGLEVHKQNSLFQYFSDNFEYLIEKDKKEGKYDMGILGTHSCNFLFNAVPLKYNLQYKERLYCNAMCPVLFTYRSGSW